MIKQHTHSKIPNEILDSCFTLYSEKGWKLLWIARKYNIYHTSLFYHIVKRGITRKITVLTVKPAEVETIYRSRLHEIHTQRQKKYDIAGYSEEEDEFIITEKTYEQLLKDSLRRKNDKPDNECSHPYWIKKCSVCSAILESDTQLNELPSIEPVRLIYHEFDKIVCSHNSALDLQQTGVCQNSILYWMYYDHVDMLTLRVKNNLPTMTDENAIATAAFTTQELVCLLLKLPSSLRDASFMNKLALNGDNPTYLAKLLLRSLRKLERTQHQKKIRCIDSEPVITEENSSVIDNEATLDNII